MVSYGYSIIQGSIIQGAMVCAVALRFDGSRPAGSIDRGPQGLMVRGPCGPHEPPLIVPAASG